MPGGGFNQPLKAQPKPQASPAPAEGEEGEAAAPPEEDFDEDDSSLSLAAMEATLKPKILETLEEIANRYKKLVKLQEAEVDAQLNSEELSTSQERRFKKLKNETVEHVKSLRLNNNRIDSLVELMYGINKRLIALESRLLRMAEAHGVPREEFLERLPELDAAFAARLESARRAGKLLRHVAHLDAHGRARVGLGGFRRQRNLFSGRKSLCRMRERLGETGEIAGHLHPAARIRVESRLIRRRCFATDGERLVLPAFGAYAGGLNILDKAFDGLFSETLNALMLGGTGVYPFAAALLIPDARETRRPAWPLPAA